MTRLVQKRRSLRLFLQSVFTSTMQLRRFLDEFGEELSGELPDKGARNEVFEDAVQALERRGAVARPLFLRLQADFPARNDEIVVVAREWGIEDLPRVHNPLLMAVRRTAFGALIGFLGSSAGIPAAIIFGALLIGACILGAAFILREPRGGTRSSAAEAGRYAFFGAGLSVGAIVSLPIRETGEVAGSPRTEETPSIPGDPKTRRRASNGDEAMDSDSPLHRQKSGIELGLPALSAAAGTAVPDERIGHDAEGAAAASRRSPMGPGLTAQIDNEAGGQGRSEASEPDSPDEPPRCLGNALVAPVDVLAIVLADLRRIEPRKAITMRYFSLAHLASAGYCEDRIDVVRSALLKLVNHLSKSPHIRIPVAVNRERTVYRIDLMDYRWSLDQWWLVEALDPYRVGRIEGGLMIKSDIKVVRADWFIYEASRPPLYHTLLELPVTRFELEQMLGLDVASNIKNEQLNNADIVVRSGVRRSRFLGRPRVIERHKMPFSPRRSYWITYDIEDASDDLFKNPLDLSPAESAIMFMLPNGLPAYMLVDATGGRVNERWVVDARGNDTRADPRRVINGVSCIGCHDKGVHEVTDEVGPFVAGNSAFGAREQELVTNVYAPPDVFRLLQAQDIAAIGNSNEMTAAQLRFGAHEPVMAVALAFERPLDGRGVAAELGVTEDELNRNLEGMKGLAGLSWGQVERLTFQSNFRCNFCLLRGDDACACPD